MGRKSASSEIKGITNARFIEMPAEDLQNISQMSTPKKISKLTNNFNVDIWACEFYSTKIRSDLTVS